MKRFRSGALEVFTIFLILVPLTLIDSGLNTFQVYALNESCPKQNARIHDSCEIVTYEDLPSDLKQFMKKLKCDVTSFSNYDYGFSLDLNDDGEDEYAFCCNESPHGPCGMFIFGKVSGKWKVLFDEMMGFYGGDTPCFGFKVQETKNEGYYDICIFYGSDRLAKFKDGKYRVFQTFH